MLTFWPKKIVGIIGYGNMGSAIAERIKTKYQVLVFDKDAEKTRNLKNVKVFDNILDLAEKADILILAVKPQDFDTLLKDIKENIDNKLIISIAAGISTRYIENILGTARVIRVMPNIGAIAGKATSCLCKGNLASMKDLKFSERLFRGIGKTSIISEDKMPVATAVSGSGPGFYADKRESNSEDYNRNPQKFLKDFIVSLARGGEKEGLTKKEAEFLASTTGVASEYLIVKIKIPPLKLKQQVASKGGTTEAGLAVLHSGGSVEDAVKAAKAQAEKLSKG
ncbi:MAG: pyrroline-5-carboxylate reductase [Candidatus Omnitrophota bacterium]|jgi:pyrroline-5-carboxylate reductase